MLFKNGRYANVASTLALVVALGGTSYAAVAIPKNSVGSKQIKNNAVKSKDLKDNGVTGADVKEATLGTVPNATAVGGVVVTPVNLSMTGISGQVLVAELGGSKVFLDCAGVNLSLYGTRPVGSPPILITRVTDPGGGSAVVINSGEDLSINQGDGQVVVSIVDPTGGGVTVDAAGVGEANSGGGTNDCFWRGTVTRVP